MEKQDRLKNLLELVKAKKDDSSEFRFEYKKCCNLFPFNSRKPERPSFVNGFDGVVGAYTRSICGMPARANIDIETSINDILKKVLIANEEDKQAFIEIVNHFIYTVDGKLNVFSAPAFKYCLFTPYSQEKKGEAAIGEYLYHLFGFPKELISKFDDNKNSNFFEELILNTMWIAPQSVSDENIFCKMEDIKNLFLEDLQVLFLDEEYFLKSYPTLLAYYYFYYVSQLSILINKGINANITEREKVYFLFDQEKVSKTKKASNTGYKMICDCSRHLLANINVIAEINAILGTRDLLLPEISELFEEMDESEQADICEVLDQWIAIVNRRFNKESIECCSFSEKIEYLLKVYKTEKTAFGEGTGSRYALWIEQSAKSYFTRTHGGSGTVLNVSQDFLLLLLHVCKKGKRMKIKEFFSEMEKRGISFDSESKLVIENRLSDLNLLDKKSDSGEAAYV